MKCVFMVDAVGPGHVVLLKGKVDLNAEAEVDGLMAGGPAFEDGELIESRAGFEKADGGGVPGVLDLGAGEEWGGNG